MTNAPPSRPTWRPASGVPVAQLATAGTSPAVPPRIVALDVLRGFALTGIIFVNVETVTGFRYVLPTLDDPSGWLQLFVQQRFFPLFSLLFGISFSLMVASAQRRGARPRVVLARRLLVLLPLGALHQVFHPGEALAFYAIIGLLVLLPSTWLPRRLVAVGGAALFAVPLFGFGGGLLLIPGLFLIGSAMVRYGVVARIESSTRAACLFFVAFVVVAIPALLLQVRGVADSGFSISSGVCGAAMAGAYATGMLLLLGTRVRPALVAVFEPLGRTALTNYLSATAVMVVARHPLHLQDGTSWTTLLGLAAGIIVVQALASRWWLARYRYGPMEWLWGWATWGRRSRLAR